MDWVQYLSDQILVLHHTQLSPCSLSDPFPCHQVANQHRSWANIHWTNQKQSDLSIK